MISEENAMISIRPEFVNSILAGTKTVEVRRRFIKLSKGTTLWIYSTLPTGAIVATATLSCIDHDTPKYLWQKYQKNIDILKKDYNLYFHGCSYGVALTLSLIKKISPIPLDRIREIRGVKAIPQVAVRVSKHEASIFTKAMDSRF